MLITGYNSPTSVNALVVQQLPESVVGTVATASNTWTFSGNGVNKVFTIAGATSPLPSQYSVTVNGSTVVDNPYNTPTTGGSGGGGGNNTGAPGEEQGVKQYWDEY